MNEEQEDAIWSAYLGICVLQTMCRKAGLVLGAQRSKELMIELGTAFPFIPERIGKEMLRAETKVPKKTIEFQPILIENNDRGFAIGRFADRNNNKCYIQKSSLATENCVWLAIQGDGQCVMHLNQAMAASLVAVLQRFIDSGEL